jgi:hypothetical protein
MDELASDRENVSVKPLVMVAATLVAAVLGAVVTVRPANHPPAQQPRPSVGVVVIESPRASALHRHRMGDLHDGAHALHPPSTVAPESDWV